MNKITVELNEKSQLNAHNLTSRYIHRTNSKTHLDIIPIIMYSFLVRKKVQRN